MIDPREVTAVVLAGGLGTRVRHLLPDIPKPMAEVGGRPFLEWVIRYLVAGGVSDIVVSTGYKGAVIEKHFKERPVKGAHVICRPELQPLGTGGGFLNACIGHTRAPKAWLVLNGDSLMLTNLGEFIAVLATARCDAAVLGVEMSDAARFGTLRFGQDGMLQAFLEKQPGKGVINAGMYLLRHSVVSSFPSARPLSFETDVFPDLVRRGIRVGVHVAEGSFLDIGSPDSLSSAPSFIESNLGQFDQN